MIPLTVSQETTLLEVKQLVQAEINIAVPRLRLSWKGNSSLEDWRPLRDYNMTYPGIVLDVVVSLRDMK